MKDLLLIQYSLDLKNDNIFILSLDLIYIIQFFNKVNFLMVNLNKKFIII